MYFSNVFYVKLSYSFSSNVVLQPSYAKLTFATPLFIPLRRYMKASKYCVLFKEKYVKHARGWLLLLKDVSGTMISFRTNEHIFFILKENQEYKSIKIFSCLFFCVYVRIYVYARTFMAFQDILDTKYSLKSSDKNIFSHLFYSNENTRQ